MKTSPFHPNLTRTEFPFTVKVGARLGGQPGYNLLEVQRKETCKKTDKEVGANYET